MKKTILILMMLLLISLASASEWEFTQIGSLQVGDLLMDADGNELPITSIEKAYDKEGVMVYDLEIKDYHYYFADGVLVHNSEDSSTFLKDVGGLKVKMGDETREVSYTTIDDKGQVVLHFKEGGSWLAVGSNKGTTIEDYNKGKTKQMSIVGKERVSGDSGSTETTSNSWRYPEHTIGSTVKYNKDGIEKTGEINGRMKEGDKKYYLIDGKWVLEEDITQKVKSPTSQKAVVPDPDSASTETKHSEESEGTMVASPREYTIKVGNKEYKITSNGKTDNLEEIIDNIIDNADGFGLWWQDNIDIYDEDGKHIRTFSWSTGLDDAKKYLNNLGSTFRGKTIPRTKPDSDSYSYARTDGDETFYYDETNQLIAVYNSKANKLYTYAPEFTPKTIPDSYSHARTDGDETFYYDETNQIIAVYNSKTKSYSSYTPETDLSEEGPIPEPSDADKSKTETPSKTTGSRKGKITRKTTKDKEGKESEEAKPKEGNLPPCKKEGDCDELTSSDGTKYLLHKDKGVWKVNKDDSKKGEKIADSINPYFYDKDDTADAYSYREKDGNLHYISLTGDSYTDYASDKDGAFSSVPGEDGQPCPDEKCKFYLTADGGFAGEVKDKGWTKFKPTGGGKYNKEWTQGTFDTKYYFQGPNDKNPTVYDRCTPDGSGGQYCSDPCDAKGENCDKCSGDDCYAHFDKNGKQTKTGKDAKPPGGFGMLWFGNILSSWASSTSGYSGMSLFYDEPDPIIELDETISNILGGIDGWTSEICKGDVSDAVSSYGTAFSAFPSGGAYAHIEGTKIKVTSYNTTTPADYYLYKISFSVSSGSD